jgi:hypothetical protein
VQAPEGTGKVTREDSLLVKVRSSVEKEGSECGTQVAASTGSRVGNTSSPAFPFLSCRTESLVCHPSMLKFLLGPHCNLTQPCLSLLH